MVTEGDQNMGGEHTMQYMNDIELYTYIMY